MKFFSEGSWRFTRSLRYTRVRFSTAAPPPGPRHSMPPGLDAAYRLPNRLLRGGQGGGVGSVEGRATWRIWPHPVPPGSLTSVDAAPLPERERLLLYDEVRCIAAARSRCWFSVRRLLRRQVTCGSRASANPSV